jgi:putative ATP-binding cassette transporter
VVRASLRPKRIVARLACWSPSHGLESLRSQREAELRFALIRAGQGVETTGRFRDEEGEKRRLGLALGRVRGVARRIVYATARLTWITAGFGWISIVAPIVFASPAYFSGRCSFGGLMVVVGAFAQVNQSLRWFVDNFALLAEWRAALFRVIRFREALLMSESGRERETTTVHLHDFTNRPRPHNPTSVKVLDDVA